MRVAIIGSGLAAKHLEHLVRAFVTSEQTTQSLATVAAPKPAPELDFYRDGSGKQKAQWKRETYGRKLK